MRITEYQREQIIKNAYDIFGTDSRVYLFGSRVDDNKKGGDIDLFIECEGRYNTYDNKIKFLSRMYQAIGEQKIDIILKDKNKDDDRLVIKEALSRGILL